MDEKEKLRILLGHWMEHNHEHCEEFRQWAEKAKAFGEHSVSDNILGAVAKLEEANGFLKKALQKSG
ncbi:MAG: hypothetical protein PHV74_02485 [Dehalococcoidia bacterium]|nr:hypothetical protein [Dehalococcoidia bacterium]